LSSVLKLSDLSAEKAVLGSAMKDPATIEGLARIVRTPEYFANWANRQIWAQILEAHRHGEPVEPAAILTRLAKAGKDKDAGGGAYLIDLFENCSVKPDYYARVVAEYHFKRHMLLTLKDLTEEIDRGDSTPISLIQSMKSRIDVLSGEALSDRDQEQDLEQCWRPFPMGTLPAALARYVEAAAEAIQCDPAYIALTDLVATGAVIGNTRLMEVKRGWYEPSVFWGVVLADSSSKKSPALDVALEPVWQIQAELSEGYEQSYRQWKSDYDDWNKKRFAWGKGDSEKDEEPKPEKPYAKKIITNDITIEKLCEVLSKNPKGIMLSRDELAGWLGSFARYKGQGGGGSDLPFWLEAFRAKSYTVDRRTGDPPTMFVSRLGVSVCGTIQPGVFQKIVTDEFFESGFLFRMLVCMPPRKPKVWTEAVIPEENRLEFHRILREIYLGEDYYFDQPTFDPVRVKFTSGGKKAWIDFYGEWSHRQNESSGETTNALAKLEAYCARLALLFCVFERAELGKKREEVTEGHVRRAYELTKWFAAEAERVFAMLREGGGNQNQERLLEFIGSLGGEITPRRLFRSNPSRYKNTENCETILDALVRAGHGTWEVKTHPGVGGRPSRTFVKKPDKTKPDEN
jgi:hypothetical protein